MGMIRGWAAMGKMAGVAPETVRAWFQKGVLSGPTQTMKGWEIDEEVFRAFLASRSVPKASTSPPVSAETATGDHGREFSHAFHLLEIALTEAHDEIRSLREQVKILLEEDREKGREIRALEAEMRAMLQGVGSPHPSRWVKAGNPVESTPEAKSPGTKRTPFTEDCLRLSAEGKTPDEIATILGKRKANVLVALKSA